MVSAGIQQLIDCVESRPRQRPQVAAVVNPLTILQSGCTAAIEPIAFLAHENISAR
jgi:hypothetical protein